MFLGRGYGKLGDLRIAHVGDQLLRPFAERVNLFGLIQVLQEKLLVQMILKLLNQLFDCFDAIRVLLLDTVVKNTDCLSFFETSSSWDQSTFGY